MWQIYEHMNISSYNIKNDIEKMWIARGVCEGGMRGGMRGRMRGQR